MASLTLHIGTHKTGTTYLQSTFRGNAEALEAVGWHFPQVRGRDNHLALGAPFWADGAPEYLQRMLAGIDLSTAGKRADMLAEFDGQLRGKLGADDHWIVSAENFWTSFAKPDHIQAFADYFRERFDDIQVIVFFRRQDHYLPSIYAQRVKTAGVAPSWTWEDYLRPNLPELDYSLRIEPWISAFGDGNVAIRPYLESFKKDSGAVLREFVAAAGMPVQFDWVLPPRPVNNALSAEGVAFVDAVRELVPTSLNGETNKPLRRRMFRAMADLTDRRPVQLTPDMLAKIQEATAASNAKLIARCAESPDCDQRGQWQQWHDQPVPSLDAGGLGVAITPARVAALVAALAVPRGPIDWGQPGGRPVPKAPAKRKSLLGRTR